MQTILCGLSYSRVATKKIIPRRTAAHIELLNAKEGENVEFKEAKNSYEFVNLAKYACAVSNLGGGRVVFGITYKRSRKVVVSQTFEQPESTRKGLIDKLHVRIDFENTRHQRPGRACRAKLASTKCASYAARRAS